MHLGMQGGYGSALGSDPGGHLLPYITGASGMERAAALVGPKRLELVRMRMESY